MCARSLYACLSEHIYVILIVQSVLPKEGAQSKNSFPGKDSIFRKNFVSGVLINTL